MTYRSGGFSNSQGQKPAARRYFRILIRFHFSVWNSSVILHSYKTQKWPCQKCLLEKKMTKKNREFPFRRANPVSINFSAAGVNKFVISKYAFWFNQKNDQKRGTALGHS